MILFEIIVLLFKNNSVKNIIHKINETESQLQFKCKVQDL